jgi:UDP-glucose 4-epimerase
MLYADPSKIKRELGWSAQTADLDEIVASAWAWMRAHPNGYAGRQTPPRVSIT